MRKSFWKYLLLFLAGQFIGMLAAVVFGVFEGVLSRVSATPGGEGYDSIVYALPLLVANTFIIALFFMLCPLDVHWATLVSGWQKPRLNTTMRYVIAALGLIPCVNILQELLLSWLPDWVGTQNLNIILSHPIGLFTVCLLGPVAEELVFRAGMLRLPEADGAPLGMRAIVISSLLFALVHFNPSQMPAAFVIGLLLGTAYWQTRSLAAPVAIHVLNNSLAVVVGLTSSSDSTITGLLGGHGPAIMVAFAGLFWAFLWLKSDFSIYNKV